MKKFIILLVLLITVTSLSFGQTTKMRSTSVSFKKAGFEWTKLAPSNVVITLNSIEKIIIVYSQVNQRFDVIHSQPVSKDKDGDEIYAFQAIDTDGVTCNVTWMKLNSQGGRMQFYIDYSNFSILYNVEII